MTDDDGAEYGVTERTARREMQELEEGGMITVVAAMGVYVTWSGHT